MWLNSLTWDVVLLARPKRQAQTVALKLAAVHAAGQKRYSEAQVVTATGLQTGQVLDQTSPSIEKLAVLTAERVAKTRAQHVLTAALQGCLLNTRVCAELDTALNTELNKVIATAELVSTGQAANIGSSV